MKCKVKEWKCNVTLIYEDRGLWLSIKSLFIIFQTLLAIQYATCSWKPLLNEWNLKLFCLTKAYPSVYPSVLLFYFYSICPNFSIHVLSSFLSYLFLSCSPLLSWIIQCFSSFIFSSPLENDDMSVTYWMGLHKQMVNVNEVQE
jgi:hypothetical protein